MNYIITELQKIGLSDKEARVYLAAMELGAVPVQSIANKAAVNRATTYVMIDSLIERGLMSTMQKGKKRLFIAESAENIVALINDQKKQLLEKEDSIMKILPDLIGLAVSPESRPKVLFFEGVNGIERLREAVMKSGEKIIEEFSPIDEVYKFFPPSGKDHRQAFRANNTIRFIYSSKSGIVLPAREKNVERRNIPHDKYPFDGDIAIYGSRVNIIYYSPKLLGVLIEHEGIANTFHQIFSLAWKSLEINTK
jgi:sugar-specific transcriptional regulator TrmB